ncbi:MAG: hypothetical protein ACYDER_11785 [Ktedonobacteraceae bacterium]
MKIWLSWIINILLIITILFIGVCAGIIVFKLLFTPPCTIIEPHGSVCVVDGWSVAGLAATVLGVAATVLAFLGAFAVAYWWIKLEDRVNEQVTKLFNMQKAEMNQNVADLLAIQKNTIQTQTSDLLSVQKTAIDREVDELLETQKKKVEAQEQQLSQLNRKLEQTQKLTDNIIELTYHLAAVNPPWELEEWAREIKTPEAAKIMVLSYAKIVKGLISHDRQEALAMQTWLSAKSVLVIPIPYWEKALEWEKTMIKYYEREIREAIGAPNGNNIDIKEPEPLKLVREAINELRPEVEMWQNKSNSMDWYSG